MWVLVFINLMINADSGYKEPVVEGWYEFKTMEQCFHGREKLLLDLGILDGFYPDNTQAVCIQTNNG